MRALFAAHWTGTVVLYLHMTTGLCREPISRYVLYVHMYADTGNAHVDRMKVGVDSHG